AEHHDAGLEDLAALRAQRQWERAQSVLHRQADAAVDALGLPQRAVDLDDFTRTGPLVQAVDVLREERADPAGLLELGKGAMPVVRLCTAERAEAERVELPDACRIPAERVDACHLRRVV